MFFSFDRFLILNESFVVLFFLFLCVAPLFFSFFHAFLSFLPLSSSSVFLLFVFCLFSTLLLLLNSFLFSGLSFGVLHLALAPFLAKLSFILLFLAFCLLSFPLPFFEIFFLFSLILFAFLLLFASTDFLTFYLSIELFSFASYLLTAASRLSLLSLEAAFKYFVLGASAASFMLLGFSYLYGFQATIVFGDFSLLSPVLFSSFLSPDLNELNSMHFGLSCFFLLFCFKLGLAPFHSWLPDVYSAAPRLVSAFFALIPKLLLFILLLRFLLLFSDFHAFLSFLLGSSSILSLLLGSLGALAQTHLLRFLAFSSIFNLGFATLPLLSFHFFSLFSSLSFLFIYTFLSFSLFSFFSLFSNLDQLNLSLFSDLSSLSSFRVPVGLFLLFLFSNAGIPPFVGFFSKFLVVFSFLTLGFFLTASLLLFFSALPAFYYLRLIRFTFFLFTPTFFFNSPLKVSDSLSTALWTFPNLLFLFFSNSFFLLLMSFLNLLLNFLVCLFKSSSFFYT